MGLEMVACTRRELTLSAKGCASLYLSTLTDKDVKPWEGRAKCVGCAIGRERAGLAPMAAPIAPVGARWCFRCEKTCERVIHKRLCVSCFNREREAVGTAVPERVRRKPGVAALRAELARHPLTVIHTGGVHQVLSPLARNRREAMEVATIDIAGPVSFSRGAIRWPGRGIRIHRARDVVFGRGPILLPGGDQQMDLAL